MLLKRLTVFVTLMAVFALNGCKNSGMNDKAEAPAVTSEFRFSVLKIGKADAIIMKTQNNSIIIDCGEKNDGDEILELLSENGINSVDYLFITHFDKDHVGGATEVIDNIEINHIITPDYKGTNDEYESYIAAITENNIIPIALTDNMSFVLDDVLFEVYPPMEKSYSESDNDFSIAVSVTHGDNNFLFTGDAEETRLTEILFQTDIKYDFLKVPHHGRFNKFTEQFIGSVSPAYSVITCSKKNPADEQTVNALEAIGSSIYYTEDGDIDVSSDGSEIIIKQ